jgi:uncharacterized membrane protein
MSGALIVFLIGVLLLALWVVLGGSTPKADASMDVLRRRLAAVEISPEDFEKTKKALGA